MNGTKDFLMRGPEILPPTNPLLGVKFISCGSIEFIGDVTQIIDTVAIIKDPILLGRDVSNPKKFNFVIFHKANPIVQNEIQVPLSAISFMCRPDDVFIKNYMAAKSGLVAAINLHDIRGNG